MSGVLVRMRRNEQVKVSHPKGDATIDYLTITLGNVCLQIDNENAQALADGILKALDEYQAATVGGQR